MVELLEAKLNINKIIKEISPILISGLRLEDIIIKNTKIKEHFFKIQRRIKPYLDHKIYSTDYFVIKKKILTEHNIIYNFNNEPIDERGRFVYNLFNNGISLKVIGKATYQYCCDKSKKHNNYFLLEISLKKGIYLGDEVPLKFIVTCSFPKNELTISVTNNKYEKIDYLTTIIKQRLYNTNILT